MQEFIVFLLVWWVIFFIFYFFTSSKIKQYCEGHAALELAILLFIKRSFFIILSWSLTLLTLY